MKAHIRIKYVNFWHGFDPQNNWFTDLLREQYDVELCDEPDFLFYSCFGRDYLNYRCLRIFYSGENRRPDFRFCDYAFSFDHLDHPNHYRLPNFARKSYFPQLVKVGQRKPEEVLASKKRFCNFVYSNRHCTKRNRFFEKLCKYKRVDSGGRWLNNMGKPVADKLALLRESKFTIAFENSSYPGYTTEKIVDPMSVDSLPIYWGNPLVHRDFNPRSFINYYDHGNEDALIEHIIRVDRDDELYLSYLRQPWLHDNRIDPRYDRSAVLARFDNIFNTPITPVAVTRRNVHYLDLAASRLTRTAGRLVNKVGRLWRGE